MKRDCVAEMEVYFKSEVLTFLDEWVIIFLPVATKGCCCFIALCKIKVSSFIHLQPENV
jgi:hypothetical protein